MAGGLNLKKRITDCHYGGLSPCFTAVFALPALVYFLIISIKNFLYKIGILKEKKVGARVICVGNLTTGGVGKTPVVIEIANYLANKGNKVAVLSRGYGGKLDNKIVNLIRTYGEILIDDPLLSGDEANLISKSVSNAAVITCANRVQGANFAVEKLGANVIVMDDGFSNRKIHKDLGLVLIDSEKKFGNGFCLPLGPLREPVSELRRADMVILTDKTGSCNGSFAPAEKYGLSCFECKMEPSGIYRLDNGALLPEGTMDKEVAAFCAIGSPEQFYKMLENSGCKLSETFSFDDHTEYTQKLLDNILAKTGGKPLVTTEKDGVKLKNLKRIENIYLLKLRPKLDLEKMGI